jgi:hypothetical protein
MTNYAKFIRGIKSKNDMAKIAINKKKTLHREIGLKFKEEIFGA